MHGFKRLMLLGSFIALLGAIWPAVAAHTQARPTPGARPGSLGPGPGVSGPSGTPVVPTICGVFQVVSSPNVGTANNALNAVAGVAANDVWAVGSYVNSGVAQTLTEHWGGTSWSVVSSPNVGTADNTLAGVAAVASNDVWAVGSYVNSGVAQTLTEHWNGTSWSVVSSPSPGSVTNFLGGVVALAGNNVWASGQENNGSGYLTLTEQWNGMSWSVVSNPGAGASGATVVSLSALSASNIWGVGGTASSGSASQTLTEQWNGTSWSVVSSPNVVPQLNYLGGVVALSASDVWAVGTYSAGGGAPTYTLTEQWNGTSWSVVSSPNPGSAVSYLSKAAATSATNVVAVGYSKNTSGPVQTLIEQLNGGIWITIPSPNVGSGWNLFNGVAVIAPVNCWAVGYYINSGGVYQTLIEHG